MQETRPAAKVWKIDPKIPVHIVVADPPVTDPAELTPIVYPAEYAAATELSLYLTQTFKCKIKHICSGSDFPQDTSLEDNLIIVGGPNHNPIFREFMEMLDRKLNRKGMSLPYSFSGYDLIRASDGHVFSAVVNANKISYDVGLVVLTVNPLNDRARVVFLAGCRTYGCLAAARAVNSPQIRKTAELISDKDVESFVVGVRVIGQYLGKLELLDPAET